jgi:excisionase family DNA binding protein
MGCNTQQPNTIDLVPEWLTVTEAARYLKVDRKVLYRLMSEGKLAYSTTKWSGRRRIRREDLDQLLQSGDGKQR